MSKKDNIPSIDNELFKKLFELQLHHNTNHLKLNVEADMMQLKYYMEMKFLALNNEPCKLFKKEYKEWQEELDYYNSKIRKYEDEFNIDSKELEDSLNLISSLN